MKFNSDIDIDFGDRTKVLEVMRHIPASIKQEDRLIKHNSGVYFTEIPVDPFSGVASIEHKSAEERGYVKLDLLNVNLYNQVRDEAHLTELMAMEPAWDKLIKMPEAANTIPRLAMFMAIIRPAKRHLIGLSWAEVAKTIWTKPDDNTYYFKKAHAVAYAHLVVVHMNLLQ